MEWSGEVALDGMPLKTLNSRKHGLGFVPQEDMSIGDITCRETLELSCQLRKKQSLEQSARDADVSRIEKSI